MPESILIVDDDQYSREYLRLLLLSVDYEVHEAENGELALQHMRKQPPDLVLLDIVMPGRDGLDVCREMKSDPALEAIPVIILSSKSDVDDKIAGLDLGASDYVPKPFDAGEVLARVRVQLKLLSLTNQLRQANKELTLKQQLLEKDLVSAGRIQKALLPKGNPASSAVEIAWRFQPSQMVGGDIFNVVQLGPHHLGFYVLDVSGHGVHSALVAVSAFQSLLPQGGNVLTPGDNPQPVSPADVLERLDTQFPMDLYEQYFTIFYLIVNTATGEAKYSSAGHPPGILLSVSGGLRILDKGGSFIGMGGIVPFEEETLRLSPGDRIILFTDGLTDFENGQDEFYGEDRFRAKLLEQSSAPLEDILSRVWEDVFAFGAGHEPRDDISLLGITFCGG